MTGNPIDRRRHSRINIQKAICIEVARCSRVRGAHTEVIRFETVDVSRSRLRAFVLRAVPVNSLSSVVAPIRLAEDPGAEGRCQVVHSDR